MSSTSLLRIAARAQPSTFFRANGLRSLTPRCSNAVFAVPALIVTSGSASSFSTSSIRRSDEGGHHEESFEEFTARYAIIPNGLESVLLSIFLHSRNGAVAPTIEHLQLLTFRSQNIDTRRSLMLCKMSLSFRCVPLVSLCSGTRTWIFANYRTTLTAKS